MKIEKRDGKLGVEIKNNKYNDFNSELFDVSVCSNGWQWVGFGANVALLILLRDALTEAIDEQQNSCSHR